MPGRSNLGTLTSLDAWGRSPNVRSSSPSIVRRRSRGSLPRLHLKHIAAFTNATKHAALNNDSVLYCRRTPGPSLSLKTITLAEGWAMMTTATTNRRLDVLTGLRQLLRRLESRQVSVKQGNADVTSQEIAALRSEIEDLERTFSRLSGEG